MHRKVDSADEGLVSVEGAVSDRGELADEVAAQLGAALLFISEGVRWGEGPQLAAMAVRMLPSLLRLQVCVRGG